MKMPRPTTVDFETYRIERRPHYPPKPVGVSIKEWGKKPRYYAFGHTTENNCSEAEAKAAYAKAMACPEGVLFQNAKFDTDVAEVHWGIKPPAWDKVHDTMFLIYLDDPHAKSFGLKQSAERLLDIPPEEQDAVADWLVEHQPMPELRIDPITAKVGKIGRGKGSKHSFGAYIAYAPGKLVADYANGDVDRTEKLFRLLWPKTQTRKMLPAYDRERELMTYLLDMERQGMRVDVDRLEADVAKYEQALTQCEVWLRKKLKVNDINFDANEEVVEALVNANLCDVSLMGITPTGKVKSDKAAFANGITDKALSAVLQYTTQMKTCLRTFMQPWLATALQSGGLIFTNWNQIKGERGGTSTGRLSSTPNFQNIPKEFYDLFGSLKLSRSDLFIQRLPALPLCRGYVIPFSDDEVLIGRDYSQQEPRILAHFEDGALKDQYVANPWIDYHDNAKENLERLWNRKFDRKKIKILNLGIIYGQGIGSLAEKNGETVESTKELRDSIYSMYPGLKDMYTDMRTRARNNQPIRTWGGREYYCEPSIIFKGRTISFDYKMVNLLIQGSAADATKEAAIRFYRAKKPEWKLILQVHDELVCSVPKKHMNESMEVLRVHMESVEFDVQILSEGAVGINWAAMADYDKKGQLVVPFELKKVS